MLSMEDQGMDAHAAGTVGDIYVAKCWAHTLGGAVGLHKGLLRLEPMPPRPETQHLSPMVGRLLRHAYRSRRTSTHRPEEHCEIRRMSSPRHAPKTDDSGAAAGAPGKRAAGRRWPHRPGTTSSRARTAMLFCRRSALRHKVGGDRTDRARMHILACAAAPGPSAHLTKECATDRRLALLTSLGVATPERLAHPANQSSKLANAPHPLWNEFFQHFATTTAPNRQAICMAQPSADGRRASGASRPRER